MKKWFRRLLTLVLACTFVISGVMLLRERSQKEQALEEYDLARMIAEMPAEAPEEEPEAQIDDTPAPLTQLPELPEHGEEQLAAEPVWDGPETQVLPEEKVLEARESTAEPIPENILKKLQKINVAALQEENPDVVGWITIPGTMVDYPLMQGTDNQYYLNYTWQKTASYLGSIYMDYRNERDFTDFNTIIYGHRIDKLTMFSSLRHYEDQEYYEENPCVYIVTESDILCYDIFAAYEVDTSDCDTYRLGLEKSRHKQAYIDYILQDNLLETDVEVGVRDYILTMSTCTHRGGSSSWRWIVQAVLRKGV